MTRDCCTRGPHRPLVRRLPAAAASVMPGAVLVLLPKCPLCLAAWLAAATGIGISATAAGQVRMLIVIVWIAAAALAAARLVRHARRSPRFHS